MNTQGEIFDIALLHDTNSQFSELKRLALSSNKAIPEWIVHSIDFALTQNNPKNKCVIKSLVESAHRAQLENQCISQSSTNGTTDYHGSLAALTLRYYRLQLLSHYP